MVIFTFARALMLTFFVYASTLEITVTAEAPWSTNALFDVFGLTVHMIVGLQARNYISACCKYSAITVKSFCAARWFNGLHVRGVCIFSWRFYTLVACLLKKEKLSFAACSRI
jgi:hypothetical protein